MARKATADGQSGGTAKGGGARGKGRKGRGRESSPEGRRPEREGMSDGSTSENGGQEWHDLGKGGEGVREKRGAAARRGEMAGDGNNGELTGGARESELGGDSRQRSGGRGTGGLGERDGGDCAARRRL
uniref:Retrotransposon protein, putative, Ty3-gypsy subclass n=1 Tax=Oryza sativa subsp. japonica TaxID=39947 RepID=Q2R8U7_ORYSJ|nr:retrotransposon protein, putative, Ty3-gypsy subclass [Oryza sativa Japonica Group]